MLFYHFLKDIKKMGKNKNIITLLMTLLILIVMGGGYYIWKLQSALEKQTTLVVAKSKKIPKVDFKLTSLSGKIFNVEASSKRFVIKGMENKIVFLKVFGWDCKFCKKEIPQLIKLKNDLSDRLDIIAIEAQQHTEEESKQFIKDYGINYHIVSGDDQGDFYIYLQQEYHWNGVIPLTIVISKEGTVLAFEMGSKSYTLAELMKASLINE